MFRSAAPLRRVALAAVGLVTLAVGSPIATAAPVAPTGLTLSSGAAGLTLNWADSSSDETGFSIERCSGTCSGFGQIATVPSDVASYVDTMASLGLNRYRVRAYNGSGASSYSNTVEMIVLSTGEVAPLISATPVDGYAPLTVTFDASASYALNGTISGYAWSFGDNAVASGAVVSHTYTTAGVYAARMKATSTGPWSSAASTAVLITVSAPPLAAPADLSASVVRGQIALRWTNPPVSAATSLAVERCAGAGCTSFARLAVLPVGATGYTDSAIKRKVLYTYRLAASDGAATVYSNTASASSR